MTNNQHRLTGPFHLMGQWFESERHVHVTFASRVTVRKLVSLATLELRRIVLLDLFVRHAVAGAGIQLIEIAPSCRAKIYPSTYEKRSKKRNDKWPV